MGYWYSIIDANVHVPKEHLGEVYERLVALHKERNKVYGATDPAPDSLTNALTGHHFSFDLDTETGELHLWGGSSKYHFDFPIAAILLAFCPDESYVVWQGEGGTDFVRQIVKKGEVVVQNGNVTFAGY